MLIKWITCRVTDPEGYSRGQQTWAELRDLPGFRGQGGGWSRRDPDVAHIFGCWSDRPSYEAFMAEMHDRIAPAQLGTYRDVLVSLFEHHLDIGERFPADFADASLIRIAHCHVPPSRQTHFIRAQAEIWNPGMARAVGMRRGVFARRGESEFLVLSLWRSAADHERYLNDHFPVLRRWSGAADDLDSITGDLVELEPTWTVPAS